MEDLLASIRKAIDNDVAGDASSTTGQSRGTLMRGALREMRVNLNDARAQNRETAEEIAELRGRILRNATDVPPIPPPQRRMSRPAIEPARPPRVPPPPRADFKGIMAGPRPEGQERRLIDQRALPPPLPAEPPPQLRGRTLQDEFDDLTYAEDQARQAYQEAYDHPGTYQEAAPAYADPRGYYPPPPQQPRMLSHHAEATTQAAFQHLSETLFAQGLAGRTLEEVTSELLRGMLKQWLDNNLPPLVERLVREEIARVARNGR
jgi:cell pole-organizing protein PopZ